MQALLAAVQVVDDVQVPKFGALFGQLGNVVVELVDVELDVDVVDVPLVVVDVDPVPVVELVLVDEALELVGGQQIRTFVAS